MSTSPILVTGAGGFIGRRLVRRLMLEGHRVRALLLPGEAVPAGWREVEVLRGDVTDGASVEAAVEGVSAVAHLAAVVVDWGPEELFQQVTVGGTEKVLRAAARTGARVMLASSIVVYGRGLGRGPCPEETPYGTGLGPYSRAKIAQERLAWQMAEKTGLRLSVVRPANVFGPGSGPWVEMVLPLLQSRQLTLIDGGDFDAGLCQVDNLAQLMYLALTVDDAVGRVYNGADGFGITWRRYFGDLAEIVEAPSPRSAPRWAAVPLATASELTWKLLQKKTRPPITHEALNLASSDTRVPIERARRELGYQPSVTYEEALEQIRRSLQAPADDSAAGTV